MDEDIVDMGGNQKMGTSNVSTSHSVYSRPQPEIHQPVSIRLLMKLGINNPKVGSLILLAFSAVIVFITILIFRSASTSATTRPIPSIPLTLSAEKIVTGQV